MQATGAIPRPCCFMQWRRAAYSGINGTSAVFALWHVLHYTLVGGGQQRQDCASCGNMQSFQECDCLTVLQALVHCLPYDCYNLPCCCAEIDTDAAQVRVKVGACMTHCRAVHYNFTADALQDTLQSRQQQTVQRSCSTGRPCSSSSSRLLRKGVRCHAAQAGHAAAPEDVRLCSSCLAAHPRPHEHMLPCSVQQRHCSTAVAAQDYSAWSAATATGRGRTVPFPAFCGLEALQNGFRQQLLLQQLV
jgi:hypothetical protein